jgi:putative transposase
MPGRHFRHPWQSDAGGRTPKVGALDDAWSSCRVFGHCPDDADFPGRWNVLKGYFSRNIEKGERVSASRKSRRERRVWQRRFWSNCYEIKRILIDMSIIFIRIRLNKVGSIRLVIGHFSFLRYLEQGIYTEDWGDNECHDIDNIE